jgi:hypothetical protein
VARRRRAGVLKGLSRYWGVIERPRNPCLRCTTRRMHERFYSIRDGNWIQPSRTATCGSTACRTAACATTTRPGASSASRRSWVRRWKAT